MIRKMTGIVITGGAGGLLIVPGCREKALITQ